MIVPRNSYCQQCHSWIIGPLYWAVVVFCTDEISVIQILEHLYLPGCTQIHCRLYQSFRNGDREIPEREQSETANSADSSIRRRQSACAVVPPSLVTTKHFRDTTIAVQTLVNTVQIQSLVQLMLLSRNCYRANQTPFLNLCILGRASLPR